MLSRLEAWNVADPCSPDTASILPCAQRIRLPCQLLSVRFVPGDEDVRRCSSWEVHIKARMLDLEGEYPGFSLWDTVERAEDVACLQEWIDRVITQHTVCIVESDIFSLGDDGLLLRFAHIKTLSRGSS